MDDIDIEIEALEELISLQKNKVELLRRKRAHDQSISRHAQHHGEKKHSSDNDRESAVADGVELNSRPSHGGAGTVLETVANAINSAIHEDDGEPLKSDGEDEEDEEKYDKFSGDAEEKSGPSRGQQGSEAAKKERRSTFSAWWANKEKASTQHEERFVDALTRLSRLTTDLANERTYLAWIRTALASARTVVSFLALAGTNQLGRVSARTCVISFAVLALLMMFQGTERYRKIKQILLTKDTPAGFARLTTLPISLALLAVLALVVLVTSTDNWVN